MANLKRTVNPFHTGFDFDTNAARVISASYMSIIDTQENVAVPANEAVSTAPIPVDGAKAVRVYVNNGGTTKLTVSVYFGMRDMAVGNVPKGTATFNAGDIDFMEVPAGYDVCVVTVYNPDLEVEGAVSFSTYALRG